MISYIYAIVILSLVLVGNILSPDATNISIRFYDSILHLLGGIGLGFFFVGLASSFHSYQLQKWSYIITAVFGAGLMWELFEIIYNITGYPLWTSLYYADTIKDLILDIVGGVLAVAFIIKKNVH